jgi:hypothetical protein
MKYENYDQFFINEYTKRYRSFVEAAMYLNDYLENLNVIVNLVYDANEQIYSTLPKFSVMRLMMSTWNREVFSKLGSIYSDKLSNLYEVYFSKEISKLRLNETMIFNKASSYEILDDDLNSNVSLMSNYCCNSIKLLPTSFDTRSGDYCRSSVSTNSTMVSINDNSYATLPKVLEQYS